MRVWMGVGVMLLASGLGQPGPVMAQDESSPRIGCFRGRPLPACRSFWIVEVQGALPVLQTRRKVWFTGADTIRWKPFSTQLEWSLGHMMNLDPSWALGGELTLGTGSDSPLTAIRARARRWLNPDMSVEAEAGVHWSTGDHSTLNSVAGPTLGLRLNIRDQGAFFVRWDVLPLPETNRVDGFHDAGGTQHGLSVGATAGSVPAVVATGAIGVGWLVLAALFLGSD